MEEMEQETQGDKEIIYTASAFITYILNSTFFIFPFPFMCVCLCLFVITMKFKVQHMTLEYTSFHNGVIRVRTHTLKYIYINMCMYYTHSGRSSIFARSRNRRALQINHVKMWFGKKKTVMKQEMFLTESLTNFILTFSDGRTVRFKVLLLKPTVLVTLF